MFTKHVAPGDGPRGGPLGTEKEKTVDREMQAAMEMYRQLVGSGMSAQEAGRVVSAAASDSLRRQLGKVVTSVDIGGEDGESPGNVRVLIRLGDEEGEGVPPASAPEGAVPKP